MEPHLFLDVLYSTFSIGLHDSFLPSFWIFPESQNGKDTEKVSRPYHIFPYLSNTTRHRSKEMSFSSIKNVYQVQKKPILVSGTD